jgi:ADP-ribose pyrophosphatase YjhB (NUDIX family)
LLDELRTIARNGLTYATNPYDRERYERLLDLTSVYYGQALDLPPAEVRQRLSAELGYITPKVGADAAVFDGEGRILLVLRADDRRWCLPCGWIEPSESPAEGAVRELREETGLEAQPGQLVGVFSWPADAGTNLHGVVAILYLCEVTGGTMQVSHESLDVRYWAIDSVPAWHSHHESLARAAQAFWRMQV